MSDELVVHLLGLSPSLPWNQFGGITVVQRPNSPESGIENDIGQKQRFMVITQIFLEVCAWVLI